ncbi:MAG TPA: SDR family NAD(P)-dependent oxidoreductase [Usitatibacter sp.]|jgi:3-oxoacyl-[acyl-carrier protein] reductase|nr:SDR family NAD(P)-dependent oxidoreductase [Usitatibacter sp.]
MSDLALPGIAGRAALVTGASRGIGAAIARELAARKARVVLTGRDEAALQAIAADIRARGGEVAHFTADVTDEDAVQSLREAAERAFGAVTLLAICAGGGGRGSALVEEATTAWRRTLEANLTSAFLTLKAFLPPMYEARHGAVVLMSSSAGRQLSGASAAYAAAKAGVQSLMRQAAADAAPKGVRVNAIAPSAIMTEQLAAQPASVREEIASGFPLGRLGRLDDVSDATLFLLSEAASWITGVTLDLAGGRVMV